MEHPQSPWHRALRALETLARAGAGPGRRAPSGRRLTPAELRALPVLARIDAPALRAADALARAARTPDVGWLAHVFCDPVSLSRRHTPKLPRPGVLRRAVALLDAGGDAGAPLRPELAAALDAWLAAMDRRRRDPAWAGVRGTPVSLAQWQEHLGRLEALRPRVLASLPVPAPFARALRLCSAWDAMLAGRPTGERFSLVEEAARLHNWPGDQWNSGDDFASAQRRFHRRLGAARRAGADPARDRILLRALYLREGLLLDPVDDLAWFLAACAYRAGHPAPRPGARVGRRRVLAARARAGRRTPGFADSPWATATDPRDVPPRRLTGVSGPGVMIDVDEDAVAALPPGCRVRRLVLSAPGLLGPDWLVYWVDSEWDDARPILNLVESAKLHPQVLFVSDGQPADLADVVRPHLDRAFEIPTNPLTAYSHSPGAPPRVPEHPDAGLV